MEKITVCITSCNRWQLLEKTLDSFLALNTYPIERYILNEDSGDKEIVKKILDKYGDFLEIIRTPKNIGLLAAIDKMYSLVNTPYIFHMEDDWMFEGNKQFMQDSLYLLNENSGVHQVWLRKDITQDWIDPENYGVYKMIKAQHCGDWCGFSFNPNLSRIEDYKRMFPNGYDSLRKPGQNAVFAEHECNLHAYKQGYRAAILNSPVCFHTGDGQSTYTK